MTVGGYGVWAGIQRVKSVLTVNVLKSCLQLWIYDILKEIALFECFQCFDSGMLVSWVAFSGKFLIIGQLSQDADKTKGSMHSSYYGKKAVKIHSRLEHDGLCYPVTSPVRCFHRNVIRTQETGFFLQLILISIVWGLNPRAR